jgi:hypothetical protein
MPGESILQTLQKVATALHRLDVQALEAMREADRSQMQADLARFKLEVDRAELRLTKQVPRQEEPPALPEEGQAED